MKTSITDIREALRIQLAGLDENMTVHLGPTEYNGRTSMADEIKLIVRCIVGPPEQDVTDRRIDQLFEDVPNQLAKNPTLGGEVADLMVTSCVGHRLYASGPGEPPAAGTEWAVKVLTA